MSGPGDSAPEGVISLAELRRLRHDLRSPLMVIAGFARLIRERDDLGEAERREYSERIERAADEIRRTLDEMLG